MAKSVSLVVVNIELLFKNRREGMGILQRDTNAKNTSVCTSMCRGG